MFVISKNKRRFMRLKIGGIMVLFSFGPASCYQQTEMDRLVHNYVNNEGLAANLGASSRQPTHGR